METTQADNQEVDQENATVDLSSLASSETESCAVDANNDDVGTNAPQNVSETH